MTKRQKIEQQISLHHPISYFDFRTFRNESVPAMRSILRFSALLLLLKSLFFPTVYAQSVSKRFECGDSVIAQHFTNIARKFENSALYDSAQWYYKNAARIYQQICKGQPSEKKMREYYIKSRNDFGWQCYMLGGADSAALVYLHQTLQIAKAELGENHIEVAQSNSNLGTIYTGLGDFDLAIDYHSQALQQRIFLLGEKHSLVASSYNNLGIAYGFKGDYMEALSSHEKSLAIRQAVLDSSHHEIGLSYRNIGLIYSYKGDFFRAISYYHKAKKIWESSLSPLHPDRAMLYDDLGNLHQSIGNYAQAEEFIKNALAIKKQLYGLEHPEIATSLSSLGNVYQGKGEYSQALECFLEALTLRLKVFGPDHPSVANSYLNIGAIYNAKGDYQLALDYFHKSLATFKTIVGEKHPNVATVHNDLGYAYFARYDNLQAIFHFEKALDIFRSIVGENHPSVADSYIGLGKVYSSQRDYQRSLEYHKKALQILIETLGDIHPDVAISYNSIGAVYYAQEDYIKAKDYFEKTLAKRLEIFGEQHPDVASSYNNLGAVYFSIGESQNALQYYQKALTIRKNLLGETHQEIAESYNNIGAAYRKLSEYTTALDYHLKALKVLNQNLGEHHPAIADTYNEIAATYSSLGAIPKAIAHYQKAVYINIREKPTYSEERLPNSESSVYNYPTMLTTLKGLAATWASSAAQNASQSSITSWEKVIEVADYAARLLHKTKSYILRENSRIDLSKDAHSLFAIGVYAAYKLDSIAGGKNSFKYKAFTYAEITKGSSLLLSLQNAKAKQIAGIPDSLLQLERNLRDRLIAYEAKLTELGTPKTKNDSTKLFLWQNEIFSVNREIEKLNAQFEKEYPRYFSLKYETPTVSIEQIQKALLESSKNQVLIEYFWDEPMLYTFYVSPTEFKIFTKQLHPDFRKWFNDIRYLLSDPLSPSLGTDTYAPLAYNLYRELLGAIQERLENKNLIIIPDQELLRLPFEALITEPMPLKANAIHNLDFRNLPFLIKQNAISYQYSATLLLEQSSKLKALRSKPQNIFQLAAFAPIFNDNNLNYLSRENQQPLASSIIGLTNQKTLNYYNKRIEPLPGSEIEVKNIAALFEKSNRKAQLFLNKAANEAVLKNTDLTQFRHIVFATHGIIPEQPELAGLLFAQDTSIKTEDNILYAGETYNLNLAAELVVLSACQTGLGKVVRGEGLLGLARGFFHSGACNLLLSLWNVGDTSTSQLMTHFYQKEIENIPHPEALRFAKLKLIQEEATAPPYFWSPFIYIGL